MQTFAKIGLDALLTPENCAVLLLRSSLRRVEPVRRHHALRRTGHHFHANRQAGHRGSLLPCALRYGRGKKRRLMLVSLRYLDTFTNVDGSWLFAERQHYP
jgi:hypothetical protein